MCCDRCIHAFCDVFSCFLLFAKHQRHLPGPTQTYLRSKEVFRKELEFYFFGALTPPPVSPSMKTFKKLPLKSGFDNHLESGCSKNLSCFDRVSAENKLFGRSLIANWVPDSWALGSTLCPEKVYSWAQFAWNRPMDIGRC